MRELLIICRHVSPVCIIGRIVFAWRLDAVSSGWAALGLIVSAVCLTRHQRPGDH